jgi:hypothetical protein
VRQNRSGALHRAPQVQLIRAVNVIERPVLEPGREHGADVVDQPGDRTLGQRLGQGSCGVVLVSEVDPDRPSCVSGIAIRFRRRLR